MRIEIDIDDALITEAMELTGIETPEAVVEKALRDYVSQHNLGKAWEELRGMGWHGDLDTMRRGNVSPVGDHQDAAE